MSNRCAHCAIWFATTVNELPVAPHTCQHFLISSRFLTILTGVEVVYYHCGGNQNSTVLWRTVFSLCNPSILGAYSNELGLTFTGVLAHGLSSFVHNCQDLKSNWNVLQQTIGQMMVHPDDELLYIIKTKGTIKPWEDMKHTSAYYKEMSSAETAHHLVLTTLHYGKGISTCFCFVLFWWDRVLLCSPSWPETQRQKRLYLPSVLCVPPCWLRK